MKLSVIIPVYNEVQNIREILKRVQATDLAWEILIVDDGSTDGTRDILKELDGTDKSVLFCMKKIRAKARRCGLVLPKQKAMFFSSKMPI